MVVNNICTFFVMIMIIILQNFKPQLSKGKPQKGALSDYPKVADCIDGKNIQQLLLVIKDVTNGRYEDYI